MLRCSVAESHRWRVRAWMDVLVGDLVRVCSWCSLDPGLVPWEQLLAGRRRRSRRGEPSSCGDSSSQKLRPDIRSSVADVSEARETRVICATSFDTAKWASGMGWLSTISSGTLHRGLLVSPPGPSSLPLRNCRPEGSKYPPSRRLDPSRSRLCRRSSGDLPLEGTSPFSFSSWSRTRIRGVCWLPSSQSP